MIVNLETANVQSYMRSHNYALINEIKHSEYIRFIPKYYKQNEKIHQLFRWGLYSSVDKVITKENLWIAHQYCADIKRLTGEERKALMNSDNDFYQLVCLVLNIRKRIEKNQQISILYLGKDNLKSAEIVQRYIDWLTNNQ